MLVNEILFSWETDTFSIISIITSLPVIAQITQTFYSQYCALSIRPYYMVRDKLFQLSTHGKPHSSNTSRPTSIPFLIQHL